MGYGKRFVVGCGGCLRVWYVEEMEVGRKIDKGREALRGVIGGEGKWVWAGL